MTCGHDDSTINIDMGIIIIIITINTVGHFIFQITLDFWKWA